MPIFLDTNILIYAYSDDEPAKQAIAQQLCSLPNRWISTQVMIEFTNIARKKMKLDWQSITLAQLELCKNFQILTTNDTTIITASRLAERYQLSWFDSLIVSAGLEVNATTLYSEDLSNKQIYENQMTVINPFG